MKCPDFGHQCRRVQACCANTLLGMDMDALLTLASLVSFFALIATWIAAPLRAPQVATGKHEAAEPAAA